jgi:hypothetical protein
VPVQRGHAPLGFFPWPGGRGRLIGSTRRPPKPRPSLLAPHLRQESFWGPRVRRATRTWWVEPRVLGARGQRALHTPRLCATRLKR